MQEQKPERSGHHGKWYGQCMVSLKTAKKAAEVMNSTCFFNFKWKVVENDSDVVGVKHQVVGCLGYPSGVRTRRNKYIFFA